MHIRTESDSYPFQRVRHYARRKILTIAGVALLLVFSLGYFYSREDGHSILPSIVSTSPKISTELSSTSADYTHADRPLADFSPKLDTSPSAFSPYTPPSHSPHLSSTLVIGTLSDFQPKLAWLSNLTTLSSPPIVYIVDDTSAPYHLEANHGREAAVYLKYIVEHYSSPSLSDVTIFWHPDEVAWHNNLLLSLSSAEAIERLNRQAVLRKGYVNARCDSWPGCPAWFAYKPSPAEQQLHPGRMADGFSEGFFKSKFPNETIPRYFANACCSQFAVSKAAIHSRPLEDYQRLYEWVRDDPFDSLTGRMMEYLWPFIFDRRGSGCEDPVACYCENYGLMCSGQGEGDNTVEKGLLRGWIEGFRRAEELGDEALLPQRQAVQKELALWREGTAAEQKSGSKSKSKEEAEQRKLRLAEEEANIRKAVANQVKATEQYKKIKENQQDVWQQARECRRRLAEMLGLRNDAGEQTLRLD